MSQVRSVKDHSGLYTRIFGGADGIRTHDLLDAIEARSQLRHGPTAKQNLVYHIRIPLHWGHRLLLSQNVAVNFFIFKPARRLMGRRFSMLRPC
jgi:hypothetical protein